MNCGLLEHPDDGRSNRIVQIEYIEHENDGLVILDDKWRTGGRGLSAPAPLTENPPDRDRVDGQVPIISPP